MKGCCCRNSASQPPPDGGGRWTAPTTVGLTPHVRPPPDGGTPRPPHDSAVLRVGDVRLAFTTDSFVVSPLFFPGGDIGKLAVYGTVNDLAMAGATAAVPERGLILEEGLPLETLRRVVASMQRAADEVGVRIVTGDTKVVDRGKGDGIFINTAGIGRWCRTASTSRPPAWRPATHARQRRPRPARHRDHVGPRGAGVRGRRTSDCASLAGLVADLRQLGGHLHCLRDLTRGGLAAALNEIAEHAGVGIELDEAAIPVAPPVAAGLRAAGAGPAVRGQRGPAGGLRPAQTRPPGASDPAAPSGRGGGGVIGTVTARHPAIVELRNPFGRRPHVGPAVGRTDAANLLTMPSRTISAAPGNRQGMSSSAGRFCRPK